MVAVGVVVVGESQTEVEREFICPELELSAGPSVGILPPVALPKAFRPLSQHMYHGIAITQPATTPMASKYLSPADVATNKFAVRATYRYLLRATGLAFQSTSIYLPVYSI